MAITKLIDTRLSVDAEASKVTYEGLSTDTKPTEGIKANTYFHELDTGNYYFFSSGSWVEMPSSGGGNSNSVETYTGTLDGLTTKFAEILNAHEVSSSPGASSVLYNGSLTVKLEIDATALGDTTHVLSSLIPNRETDSYLEFYDIVINGLASPPSGYVFKCAVRFNYSGQWIPNQTPLYLNVLTASDTSATFTDVVAYASYIPYTLTLYWHEMPTA